MRVFVTGGSGWIGSAVVPELLGAGHEVVGLARSDESAGALSAAGAEVLRGDLNDLDVLRAGAAASDGVLHLAFIHDFGQYEAANATDLRAIETMGDALVGSGRPLVIASGVVPTRSGQPATEQDEPDPNFPRTPSALATVALSDKGVRSVVVRLPPTVHGEGDEGFVHWLVGIARDKGVAGHVADGANRWPAVHRVDAASLFRLALEGAPAGSVLNAVADEGVPTRVIAESIGRHLGLPTVSVRPEDAMEHFGFLGFVFSADLPTSSDRTQEMLAWKPTGPSLTEDLEAGHYFRSSAAA